MTTKRTASKRRSAKRTAEAWLPLAAGLATMGWAAPGAAQTGNGAPTPLDEITVSAERAPSPVYNAPGTVSVKTDADIDREQVRGPRDLVRTEPGVNVGNQPARTGASNFTIRGVGENRVRLQIDGVRVPDFPGTNAGAGTFTRDFVDYDALKRVEIVRGPASALYGSDALGGVVAFVTKDPADYLALVEKNWFLGVKTGVDTADRSLSTTVTGAFRMGPWEAMVLYTRRDGRELDVNSRFRNPNPQHYQVDSVLAKLLYETPDAGRFRLTAEAFEKGTNTHLRTDLTTTTAGPTTTSVLSSRAEDTSRRLRLSLDWTKTLGWWIADELKLTLYGTELDREELTRQARAVRVGLGPALTAPNRARFSDFDFHQTIYGADAQFSGVRTHGDWEHRFTWGFTAERIESSRPRDRFETNLVTGATARTVAGDTFPNKNFPDTATTQAAFFAQDVIRYGRLRVIPALRVDTYTLDPRPDADFVRGNTRNFTISGQTEHALSPKLGLTYDLSDNLRLFGQYARGFRAPPYDNANFAFSNPVQFYEILPNGNLKPETVDGFEAGFRGRFGEGSSFQVSAFHNRYKDFIEERIVAVAPNGFTTFQFQNVDRVTISGVEGRAEWRFAPRWTAYGAAAYARGEEADTGLPINSVDPLTGVAGLRYTDPRGWSLEGRARAAADKRRVNDPNLVRPGGYAVFDLLATYDLGAGFSVNAGVFNVADRSYFNALDVAGVTRTNPNLELFRSTGRTFAASATARF